MKLNELSPQQLAQLYRQELTSAFPPEELKPLRSMLSLMEDVYKRQELEGRLQSRVYTKRLGETSEERTAFEVSVSVLERLDAPAPAEQPCG